MVSSSGGLEATGGNPEGPSLRAGDTFVVIRAIPLICSGEESIEEVTSGRQILDSGLEAIPFVNGVREACDDALGRVRGDDVSLDFSSCGNRDGGVKIRGESTKESSSATVCGVKGIGEGRVLSLSTCIVLVLLASSAQ